MSDGEPPVRPGPGRRSAMKRAPFRAWLVTGPVGRLAGFILDFARAVRVHRQTRRDARE